MLGPKTRLRPPPPALLLRPLPASLPPCPPQQVATPAQGPFSTHPHSTPSSRPGSERRGGGRERGKEKKREDGGGEGKERRKSKREGEKGGKGERETPRGDWKMRGGWRLD